MLPLPAYRRQRPRVIKLAVSHHDGFAALDVPAALSDLLRSFDAPMTAGMRLNRDNTVTLRHDNGTLETITREQLNRRYLVHLINEMGDL